MCVAAVEHGGEYSENFKSGIGTFLHFLDGIEQERNPHYGKIIGFDGNEDAISGG